MNSTEVKGNWNVIKGKLKQRYAELTDDDLTYVEGAEDELFGRLQVKLGKSKQEILDSVEKAKSKHP
ncbi:MAG TPA: CsbD family protein [Cyclobacteriaceae bacterium]|nr:CsbD family protein [Cyclobacteriaceae bacterium]